MLVLVTEALALYGVSWILWKCVRRFIVKKPMDNIPGPVAKSWLGVFPELFYPDAWALHDELKIKYGGVARITAMFGDNQLYVSDPLALHHIVVKDQYIYEETSGFITQNKLVFGEGLLATLGDQHRKQRKILNPVFSPARMREMIPIFFEVTNQLRNSLAQRVEGGPREMDMLAWMSRSALEILGQSGFGHSFDSLTEDVATHPFALAIKRLQPANGRVQVPKTYLLPWVAKIGSPSFRRFMMDLLPYKALHELRDVSDVLHKTSLEIYNSKQKALAEGDGALSKQIARGKDIMSVLLKANMEASDKDKLTENELIGQISILTFAAADTTSAALSRTLLLLATHPDVQDRLRQEIRDILQNQTQLTYDALNDLAYLDAICRETLRLYPPVATVQRTTRKDVILPLGSPIQGLDGQTISEIPIPNNTNIVVSIIGCNRDPTLWGKDSYEWKPQRWLQPLPETLTNVHIPGVYSNLMTFLGGGRACIGFKFSQLEMKVVLAVLINSFKFSLTDKDVIWEMNPISNPAVRGKPAPQLPLIIELAR